MARPYRMLFPDACYLVSLQGVEGVGLFVEPPDARHFERLLWLSGEKHRVRLHAYALAANSAWLVVETREANLSDYVQGAQTAFSRHIRHHYVQKGSIMQGRYHAKVLEKSTCLVKACEWVHGHPVRDDPGRRTPAKMRKRLERYPFSSFRQTVGLEEEGIACPKELLRAYGAPAAKRKEKHRAGCEAMLLEEDPEWEALRSASPVAIGSPEFLAEMHAKQEALRQGKRVTGMKTHGKKSRGVARGKVLKTVAKHFDAAPEAFFEQQFASMLRPALAQALYRFSKMTQGEIADYIQVGSSAAVSLQIKRLVEARAADPTLDRRLKRLESELEAL